MNIIVTSYPFERDIIPHDPEIFKNEKHFIKKTMGLKEKHDLRKPVASVHDAVAVYNEVYGCAHCVITKHDYQASKQWPHDVIKAARSLGWYHPDLDWLYKPAAS